MLEQRVIKKDGKVTGYREESNLMLIERTKREVAERKTSKEITKQTTYALELWAKWRLISSGYGDSPLASAGNPRVPPRSTPPAGCREAPEPVLQVIKVMTFMFNGSDINKKYANILHTVYLGRKSGESIELTIKRLNIGISSRGFRRAKERLGILMFK